MAINYVNDGTVLTYSNTGTAISSGDVVLVGEILGVALEDIAATSGTGAVQIEGVFDLPKLDAAVIAQGESVFWIVATSNFDDNGATLAEGDFSGTAIAMESLGATTDANIKVKINVPVATITPAP